MSANKKIGEFHWKPNDTIFNNWLPRKGELKIYEFHKCREKSNISVCNHATAPEAETQSNKICKTN